MRIKIEIPISDDIIKISQEFFKAGKEIYLVGGCVRDFLQGKIPHDFDLVTNALPEESKQILSGWNVSDEQGKNFGVLRIYTESEPLGYELAVYRFDVVHGRDTHGSDQKVEIGKHITIENDCARRDFTVNSLYYDINKKEIVDLTGGIDDIKNNIIRAVGEPHKRFEEDRLRILRCFRFAARMNATIEEKTSEAIRKDNRLKGINDKENVSQERISEEMFKTLDNAKHNMSIMQKYFDLLNDFNMWEQMFQDTKINQNINVKSLNKAILLFNLFDEDVAKKRKHFVQTLKFSDELINEISFLQKIITDLTPDNVYKIAKIKKRFHINDDMMLEFAKIHEMDLNLVKTFINFCLEGFKTDGNDLMAEGFKGEEIEKEKERLEVERFKRTFIF